MTYYDNINKLPLDRFIDCLCDQNYKALVIGDADVEDFVLQDAWMQIQEQYAEAMGNQEQRLFLKLVKDANLKAATLNQIRTLLSVMEQYYTDQFAALLNKLLGTKIKFDPYDRNSYLTTLNGCATRTKGMEMKLKIDQLSLEAMQKRMEARSGEKPTRDYFSRILNLMEEHYSVPIDERITVARYCDRIRRLNKKK